MSCFRNVYCVVICLNMIHNQHLIMFIIDQFYFSKKDIPVANYRTHTVHCAKNATKVGKENTTKASSNSDEPMLPCEFCDDLIPMRKLLEHQA